MIDRSLSDVVLSKSGFVAPDPATFGIFERWILKLGLFTRRTEGDESLTGDACVILYPNRSPSRRMLKATTRYVEQGGNLLIVDDPENVGSTANALLAPFGLSVGRDGIGEGKLQSARWPSVPVKQPAEVHGGNTCATLGGRTVAASTNRGRGTVMVIGFGRRFTNSEMGGSPDLPPDPPMRLVYEVEFQILRELLKSKRIHH
jgi:hypothetical protein